MNIEQNLLNKAKSSISSRSYMVCYGVFYFVLEGLELINGINSREAFIPLIVILFILIIGKKSSVITIKNKNLLA